MGDDLLQLRLGHTVVLGVAEVESELIGVAAGDERGDGDEASVPCRELRAVPDVLEEDVVSECGELGSNVADGPSASADLSRLLFAHLRTFRSLESFSSVAPLATSSGGMSSAAGIREAGFGLRAAMRTTMPAVRASRPYPVAIPSRPTLLESLPAMKL